MNAISVQSLSPLIRLNQFVRNEEFEAFGVGRILEDVHAKRIIVGVAELKNRQLQRVSALDSSKEVYSSSLLLIFCSLKIYGLKGNAVYV